MFPVFTDQITLHQNITSFDFSNNPIEDQAILFLSRALNHWGNVESIDLESIYKKYIIIYFFSPLDISIQEKSSVLLIDTIFTCKTLKHLNLSRIIFI